MAQLPRASTAAGYSGTPLAKKLGIKPGHTLLLPGAPEGWEVPDLPDGVQVRRHRGSTRELPADVVVAFFQDAAGFRRRGPELAGRLPRSSSLWVVWPRRAGGHFSDLTERLLRDVLLPLGLVDVKVAALDTDWSGLKFVWRKTPPASA